MAVKTYCDYFDIDEKYFPCIDASAINSGAPWKTTYPHETFIELLTKTEKMLSGTNNRSIWIHGAYGTGKSQCAYALQKILEVPEAELRAYWNTYEPLKKHGALLEKYIGHKNNGILSTFRYASGTISSPRKLFLAVQETIKNALTSRHIEYKGENTLKECVISWLRDEIHRGIMDALLRRPEWMSKFEQTNSAEIIRALESGDASSLMDNIFELADKEGITAFDITADSLRAWILDIIKQNHIKIVLIWDEFSDYFRQNATSLGEFQKIVSLCQECPFYFIIVTHPLTSLQSGYDSGNRTNAWSVVQQRFEKVEIAMPNNIAFELIGQAFQIKQAAREEYGEMIRDLERDVSEVSQVIARVADIQDLNIIRRILPIHPMAAYILKNIAESFKSNQRSMFDFIKTPRDANIKAFQWFIQNTSPISDRPYLTVDMLWDFFYVHDKEALSPSVRSILDTFARYSELTKKEQIVLKTILIMEAIGQHLGGGVDILKPTPQNLSYAFAGECITNLDNECKTLAIALCKKGILSVASKCNNQDVYSVAVRAGDSDKLEKYTEELTQMMTAEKLVTACENIGGAVSLSPALKLRFAKEGKDYLPVVTIETFKKQIELLKKNQTSWKFRAVLALAKDEREAQCFRERIREAISDPNNKDIIVVDALSMPLGLEAFKLYIQYASFAKYYAHSDKQQSAINDRSAKDVLERDWRNRIHDGHFIVFTSSNPQGERAANVNGVCAILQSIVLNKFNYLSDFAKGLSETQLRLTASPMKNVQYGIEEKSEGVIKGCEKVLDQAWKNPEYWKNPALKDNKISIIKNELEGWIAKSFKATGKISIEEIYDKLERKFGFSTSNLTAFITGFLLKEYSGSPYSAMDEGGHMESMTPNKLAEMVANYISKKATKTTYIVSLTDEERSFYALTSSSFDIPQESCSSPQQVGSRVCNKLRDLGFPVWCLKDIDTTGAYPYVDLYIKLIQSDGKEAHDIATQIGKLAMNCPQAAENLRHLLTLDHCQKGMMLFLQSFEQGKLISLSEQIGASDLLLRDIRNIFSITYSALWSQETGEDEIRKLITEYEIVKATNTLLNVSARTKAEAIEKWQEMLSFTHYSWESIKSKHPQFETFFALLYRMAKHQEILPDQMKILNAELSAHFVEIQEMIRNPQRIFRELYAPYLEGLSESDGEAVYKTIRDEMFTASATKSNQIVKRAVQEYQKSQIRTQLFELWYEKSGEKTPKSWSERYQTPILCCVPQKDYTAAKKAFNTINNNISNDLDIEESLAFIKHADFWNDLNSKDYRDQCFKKHILGDYANLLPDIEKVRDKLSQTGISANEYNDNPEIRQQIETMAKSEYQSGGSDQVVEFIKNMSNDALKQWLTDIVKKDMGLGLKIMTNQEI